MPATVVPTGFTLSIDIGENEAAHFGRFSAYGAKVWRTTAAQLLPFNFLNKNASAEYQGTVPACRTGAAAWWGLPMPVVTMDLNVYRWDTPESASINWESQGPDAITRSVAVVGHGQIVHPKYSPCSLTGPCNVNRWAYRARIPTSQRAGKDEWEMHQHVYRWDQAEISLPEETTILSDFDASQWLGSAGVSLGDTGGILSLTAGGSSGAAVRRYVANDGDWYKLSYRRLRVRVRSVGDDAVGFTLEALGGFWVTVPIKWNLTTGDDGEWVEREVDVFAPTGIGPLIAPAWSQLLYGWQLSGIGAGKTIEVEWIKGYRDEAPSLSTLYNRRGVNARYLDVFTPVGALTLSDAGGASGVATPDPYRWQSAGIEGVVEGLLTLEIGAVFGSGTWTPGTTVSSVDQALTWFSRLGNAWEAEDLAPAPAGYDTSGPYPEKETHLKCRKNGLHYHLGGGGRLRPAALGGESDLQVDLSVGTGRVVAVELWYPSMTLYPQCGEPLDETPPLLYGDTASLWGEVCLRGQMSGHVEGLGDLPEGLVVIAQRWGNSANDLGPEGNGAPDPGTGDFATGLPQTWDQAFAGDFLSVHAPTPAPATPTVPTWFGIALPDRSRARVYLWWQGQQESGRWLSVDLSETERALRAFLDDSGQVVIEASRQGDLSVWDTVETGIAEETPCLRFSRGRDGAWILVTGESGSVKARRTLDEGRSFSVASTIFTGPGYSKGIVAVGATGLRYFFAVLAGAIQGRVLDAQGATVIAEFTAVGSGVADDALGAVEKDGRVWLLYRDTGGNLITVSSVDGVAYS